MQPLDNAKTAHILPIIMAGGRGERLAPMTDTAPKPLLPIDGVPAIVRILRLLRALGFSRAAVTLGYRAEDIKSALGEVCEEITLLYTVEDTPLGTAGGVLAAWDRYAGEAVTDALVLSGDAVFTLDLAGFLAHHRRFSADATVLSLRVSDPSAFGALLCDGEGRIRAFCEKPSAMETVTDMINTGIYLFSRAFLASLPRKLTLDFGADVFPTALEEHRMLCAYVTDGYWCDIGTVESFLFCVTAIANGTLSAYSPLLAPRRPSHLPHAPNSSIGEGCFVPAGASVRNSALFSGVSIGNGASVESSVLCEGVTIGARAVIGHHSVIGAGARIASDAVLPPRTRVAPYAAVEGKRSSAPTGISVGYAGGAPQNGRRTVSHTLGDFTHDSGIFLSLRTSPTEPARAVCHALGRALVRLLHADGKASGLFFAPTREGEHITAALDALLCGALSECEALKQHRPTVFVCKEAISFVAARFGAIPDASLRVLITHTDGRLSAVLAASAGHYLSRTEERRLDALLTELLAFEPPQSTEPPVPPLYLSARRIERALLESRHALFSALPDLSSFAFSTGDALTEQLLSRLMHMLGARSGGEPVLSYHIFENGSLEDDDGMLAMSDLRFPSRVFGHWELFCMWLAACAPPPPTLSLPLGVPPYVISTAVSCGSHVALYPHYPSSDAAPPTPEACDPLILAVRITALLLDRDTTLQALYRGAFGEAEPHVRLRRTCPAVSAASTLRRMADSGTFLAEREGLSYVPNADEGGSVRVYNSRTHTLRVVADALSMESAASLCDMAEQKALSAMGHLHPRDSSLDVYVLPQA